MTANINAIKCIGCTVCAQSCPRVFCAQDDRAVVCVQNVPRSLENACRKAAEICPAGAIDVEE